MSPKPLGRHCPDPNFKPLPPKKIDPSAAYCGTFSQRVVSGWNRLPASVVDAKTVNGFKNAYDNYLHDMDDRS